MQKNFPRTPALDVALSQGPLCGGALLKSSVDGRALCKVVASKGGCVVGVVATQQQEAGGGASGWEAAVRFAGCHDGPAVSVAASQPSCLAAVGGESGVVSVWSVRRVVEDSLLFRSGRPLHSRGAEGEDAAFEAKAVKRKRNARAASALAVAAEAAPLAEPTCLRGHSLPLTAVAFDGQEAKAEEGPLLASASLDGDLRVWDMFALDRGSGTAASSGSAICVAKKRCGFAAPLSVAFSPAERRLLASAHEDGRVRVWDLREKTAKDRPSGEAGGAAVSVCEVELRCAFEGRHRRMPSAVRWSFADAPFSLASSGLDGALFVHDLRAPSQPLAIFRAQVGGKPVRLLACAWLSREALVSGGSDGRLRLHRLLAGPPPSKASNV